MSKGPTPATGSEIPVVEREPRFTEADDQLHRAGPDLDWTETSWWSFHVPARRLAGWLYVQVRPNLGTMAGGAFVYDAGGWLPWELPYYAMLSHQPVPDPLDLRDVAFPTGVRIRRVAPGMSYEIGYRFRDREDFVAELMFEGLTPPVPHLPGAPPFGPASHFDQHGRVTGEIRLLGETIAVDCLAVRDRSWGRRPERLGRRGRLSYCFGSVAADHAFLAFCLPPRDRPDSDIEHLSSGYLLRDGWLQRLVSGTRRVVRDRATGVVQRIELAASDVAGRELVAAGEPVSRMALPTHALCVNSLLRWEVDGAEGWGEDQDVWPMALFAERLRQRL